MISSFWTRVRQGVERLITGQPLRSRSVSLTGTSVAAVVLLVGSTAYLSTRTSLRDQLDYEMLSAARAIAEIINSDIRNLDNLGPGLGTSQELLTVTIARGETSQAGKQSLALFPDTGGIAVAHMQQRHRARSVKLTDGQEYRLVSVPVRARDRISQVQSYIILYARPLTSLGTTLNSLQLMIALSGLAGIVATTLTALWMVQTVLAPVRRLSTTAKNVIQTDQLDPIRIYGRDDLGESTHSFNLMLKSLQTSREQQRQLTVGAGHELRTPLTSIHANIELLVADGKSGMLPEGARSEILDDVSAQLGEFSALVDNLVVLTRDDRLQRQLERLDTPEVVEAALVRAAHRGLSITFHTRLEPVSILGDVSTLERAITNLLGSAMKFSPSDGEIWVELTSAGVLTIIDSGPGITDDDLPHIFDRFYRSGRARNTSGIGSGLAIVTHIVEAHGGSVRVGNQQGAGAKPTMRLPVLNISESPPSP